MKMDFRSERELDCALGVDTSLTDADWSARRRHPCQPTPLAALKAVAERLRPEETVVDCGCGTGRAVFYFAAAGFNTVGVELDDRRYAQAEDNLSRCKRRAPEVAERVRLICGAAQDFLPEVDAAAYYFFNPFPAAVLRGVLRSIGERRVRLFCYYPDDEWVSLLEDEGWTLLESVDLREELGRDARERVDIFRKETDSRLNL